MASELLWTCSGDSHFTEPRELFRENLPSALADRLPRSEKVSDDEEIVHIDGESFRRKLPTPPKPSTAKAMIEFREAVRQGGEGHSKGSVRLEHLDDQGVWAEVVYPSLGLWYGQIKDAQLVYEAAKVLNDHVHDELIGTSPRFVPTATLPLQSVELSIAEAQRCAELGFLAVFLPTEPSPDQPFWNDDHWEPLWAACEEAGLVIGVHIGTDAAGNRPFSNPGGAMLNYLDTTFGGQMAAAQFVAGGALERHPDLRVLISEGGATWVPFVGDRLNEAYRQHPMFDDGRLPRLPKEYIMERVYASFQHDETAVPAMTAMGYRNIMFGTDYPHIEGTYPHTQKVLHELLDGTDAETSERIRLGAFLELFPSVGAPPA
ncbi:MAG TPA: amidohydrolase family protein [Acidimicrobiia bacterium]